MFRRLALLTASIALFQAFFVMPYQHVHLGSAHDHGEEDHDDTLVHSHLYAVLPEIAHGPEVEDPHHSHASVSLDTFTILPQLAFSLAFQPEAIANISAPEESGTWVELIEPCGHDPPTIPNSIPRAPPA